MKRPTLAFNVFLGALLAIVAIPKVVAFLLAIVMVTLVAGYAGLFFFGPWLEPKARG